MDDLISRQQAIDVLNSFDVLDGHTDKEEIKERIEQLPPAQSTFDARDTQYNLPIGTDLISRAEAIDVVSKWFEKIELNADICLDGLRQLPSATDKNVGTKLGTDLAELGTDRAVKGFPIDADDLMLRVEEKYGFRSRDRLYDIIRKMPKYELPSAEPKRGKWVKDKSTGYLVCDQCRDVYINPEWLADGHWKFCPNCGCTMNEDDTNERN